MLSLRVYSNILRSSCKTRTLCVQRKFTSETDKPTSEEKPEQGGYAKAFKKFENLNREPTEEHKTFAALLKHSKFVDLGDPEGKTVTGRIFHVVEDDLYIDFGWKFHCVCPRPKKNPSAYVRGTKVRLLINSLELSSRFLGFEKDLTLLEADCRLLGMMNEQTLPST